MSSRVSKQPYGAVAHNDQRMEVEKGSSGGIVGEGYSAGKKQAALNRHLPHCLAPTLGNQGTEKDGMESIHFNINDNDFDESLCYFMVTYINAIQYLFGLHLLMKFPFNKCCMLQ